MPRKKTPPPLSAPTRKVALFGHWPRRQAWRAKSSPDSRNVRFVIATRSPDRVLKVGLLASRSEKKLKEYPGLGRVVRSLQSDFV
jgi:hypothetical protein